MAYYTNLIAIRVIDSKYEVESEISIPVNVRLIKEDHLFNDVSESSLYLDEAAIIQKDAFSKYLYSDELDQAAKEWYQALSKNVRLIIVHKLDWESGLSD